MEWKVKTNEKKKPKRNQKESKGKNTIALDIDPTLNLTQTHPCVAQYGSCQYGDSCSLSAFPATACVYHLQEQLGKGSGCVYGDTCFNAHFEIPSYILDPELDDAFDKPALSLYYQQAPIIPLVNPSATPQQRPLSPSNQRRGLPANDLLIVSNNIPILQTNTVPMGLNTVPFGMQHNRIEIPTKTIVYTENTCIPSFSPRSPHVISHSPHSPHLISHSPHVNSPHSPHMIPTHMNSPNNNFGKNIHLKELFEWKKINQENKESVTFISDSEFEVIIYPEEDNPWDIQQVRLKFTISDSYPSRLPEIEVVNPEFPDKLKRSANKKIFLKTQADWTGKEMIVKTLTWIKTNLVDILIYDPNYDPNKGEEEEEDNNGDDDDELDKKGYLSRDLIVDDEDDESSEDEENNQKDNTGLGQVNKGLGVQVLCEGVEMFNVGTIECYVLKITVICSQCKELSDIQVSAGKSFTSVCTKCNNAFAALWITSRLHQENNKLGELELNHAVLGDILPSCHHVTCLNCNACASEKSLVVGNNYQLNCRECHKLMKFKIESMGVKTFEKQSTLDLEKVKQLKGTKKKDRYLAEGIIRGQSLPKNGSCDHYKKSKRWQRFPCCHKLYSCHQCHDAVSDHTAEWANRMICGFCSAEQAIGDVCTKCSAELVSVKQGFSSHWEGGQGKRDLTTMSKKDSKKYRGMNKTVSAKSQTTQK